MARLLRLAPALALIALALSASPAGAARPLTTGFTDTYFATNQGGQRPARLQEARAAGANVVRIDLSWWGVADQPTPGDATDPGNPGYNWSAIDASARDAAAHGLSILFNVFRAPPWGEGPGKPAGLEPGTWRPNAGAYGLFAKAAARRYSGSYPDPAQPGRNLPRVRLWEAWNEPNIVQMITPQWEGGQPASPGIYRALVNAFYAGVKSVSSSNIVIAGGMSPYGDPPGGERMMPALFARQFFCLGGNLSPQPCANPPYLDVFDHHPYDVGGPARRALNADDVATPDMGKLARIVRAAERTGRALPRHRKRLWVTEFSWESNPPDPGGIPILQHARWLEYGFYTLWRAGVDTVLWYQVRDELPVPNYAGTYQSGIEFNDGSPKPTATAFRFPFISERINKKKIRVWGKTPDGGRVAIQRRAGGGWRTLAVIRPGANRVFYTVIKYSGRSDLRAVSRGGAVSIEWPSRVNLVST